MIKLRLDNLTFSYPSNTAFEEIRRGAVRILTLEIQLGEKGLESFPGNYSDFQARFQKKTGVRKV